MGRRPEREALTFSVLRGHFKVDSVKKATINVLGLGFFKCYINGKCINPDTFLPLSSEYEPGQDPKEEKLSANRIYVPQFDITPYVKTGDNVIAIQYGGGWYTFNRRTFGLPKAIYCITVTTDSGEKDFVSDESCRIGKGLVSKYYFTKLERQDYTDGDACLGCDFDDSEWENAVVTEGLDTEYCTTDCPADALIRELPVKKIGEGDHGGIVYDCGINTTGVVSLEINAMAGEEIRVIHAEDLLPSGVVDPTHVHGQQYFVTSDGKQRTVQAEFTWFGFRYFEVIGNAEPRCVKVIHANIPVTSEFDSDNETLNWIYKTFVHTMLANMHTGHPSDCPHIERRGYTGDGQVTCHAALTTLGAKAFYEKWLQDIADSQDTITGHIQNTAPYIKSGGGPGGWGCAIVEVPYQLYRHYGDKSVLEKYYGNMRRYIDYLNAHSEFGLVTSDKKGEWCLGEWCCANVMHPDRNVLMYDQQFLIPAQMINTYFMVKSLDTLVKIAKVIGKEGDIPEYEKEAEYRRKVMNAAYFSAFDGNCMMNAQGANAFAVDIGLGNDKTYSNMVNFYNKIGCFDTGIFGTDVVARVLFERGDGELATDLLVNDGPSGFEHWRRNGATTFHEYWDSTHSRSHNHHMFGAPVAYFFEYLLGIKQTEDSAGYSSLVIAPQATERFGRMSGSMMTPNGKVAVSYSKTEKGISFNVTVPEGTEAKFVYGDTEIELKSGENTVEF